MTYELDRADVDLGQLVGELSAALGVTVRIAARPPAEKADDGTVTPGVLVVIDDATDEETDRFDTTTVEQVITDHVPPEPPPTLQERLAALEAEVEGIKDRTAAAPVSEPDALALQDAVTGQ